MMGSTDYLVVGKGGRQGYRYGGINPNLGYAQALKILHASAEKDGIPLRMQFVKGAAPGTDTSAVRGASDTIVFDVTVVDDEAFALIDPVPVTLINQFKRAVVLLIASFDHYGTSINWKLGKTEAILILRDKNARAEKSNLVQEDGSKQTFLRRCHGGANVG